MMARARIAAASCPAAARAAAPEASADRSTVLGLMVMPAQAGQQPGGPGEGDLGASQGGHLGQAR